MDFAGAVNPPNAQRREAGALHQPLPMPVDPNMAPGAAALPIKNFAQFYSDETKDPCHRQYDRIMQRFDASH